MYKSWFKLEIICDSELGFEWQPRPKTWHLYLLITHFPDQSPPHWSKSPCPTLLQAWKCSDIIQSRWTASVQEPKMHFHHSLQCGAHTYPQPSHPGPAWILDLTFLTTKTWCRHRTVAFKWPREGSSPTFPWTCRQLAEGIFYQNGYIPDAARLTKTPTTRTWVIE